MAQAQIDQKKLKKDVGMQTGDEIEFCVALSENKKARFYYSEW